MRSEDQFLLVAQQIVEQPNRWRETADRLRRDAGVRRTLGQSPSFRSCMENLANGRHRLDEPLAFVLDALVFLTLDRPEYALGLRAIDHRVVDPRLLAIRIDIGDKILAEVRLKGTRQQKRFLLNMLGSAFAQRTGGSRCQQQEQAIRCFAEGLGLCDRPDEAAWRSNFSHNLGCAYQERLQGQWAENQEKAVQSFQEALRALDEAYYQHGVIGEDAFRQRYGEILANLANALRTLGRLPETQGSAGERVTEESIRYFERAIELRRHDPLGLAQTLNSLGATLLCRKRNPSESGEDVDRALSCFHQALKIYESHPAPVGRALVVGNLGAAYVQRSKGLLCENLQTARIYFQEAVDRHRALGMSWELTWDLDNLGQLDVLAGDAQGAYECLREAAELIEKSFVENSTASARHAWLRLHSVVFDNAIARAAMLGEERSAINPEPASGTGSEPAVEAARLAEISRARILAEWMNMPERAAGEVGSDRDSPTSSIKVPEIGRCAAGAMEVDQLRILAKEAGAALLTLRISRWGTAGILILPCGRIVTRLFDTLLPEQFGPMLVRWHEAQLCRPEQPEGKRALLRERTRLLLAGLGESLGRHLHQWLKDYWPSQSSDKSLQPLIVMAGQGFNVLPLHALSWHEGDKRVWLSDDYQFSYAPSCQVLTYCLQRQRLAAGCTAGLLAVRNPASGSRSLPMFDRLVDYAAAFFDRKLIVGSAESECPATFRRLTGRANRDQAATKDQAELERWEVVLLATHGRYDLSNPWDESTIDIAADTEPGLGHLTLADIFHLDLSKLGLVVMSACETAIPEPNDPTGEQVGFPAALLAAGAAACVGSLWEVEAGPTAVLIARLLHNLLSLRPENSTAWALWEAQRWMRNATREELTCALEQIAPGTPGMPKTRARPWADPYYWAAFAWHGAI